MTAGVSLRAPIRAFALPLIPLALAFSVLSLAGTAGAAIFSVNSAADGGDDNPGNGACSTGGFVVINMFLVAECTYRAAIEEANALAGPDTIDFTLAPLSGGALLLQPMTSLPSVTDTLEIDGTTLPGYDVGNIDAIPLVLLDGNGVLSGDGLEFQSGSDDSVARALAIFGFSGSGIDIFSHDVVVEGCHVGLALGLLVDGNGLAGISIGGDRAVIGQTCAPLVGCTGSRNVIVGGSSNGINVAPSAADTLIAGNRIGTTPDGTALETATHPTGNQGFGIDVVGDRTIVGATGTLAQPAPDPPLPVASGNVISGNSDGGILLRSSAAVVMGNRIGVDVTGSVGLGGQFEGLRIEGDAHTIGAPGVGANVIAANSFDDIRVGPSGVQASLNTISGNRIGVNAAATAAIGNGGIGIVIDDGVFNTITQNVVGGSQANGILIFAPTTNVIANHVGTNESGTDLGNGATGIVILGENVLVSGNTVGFNQGFGVDVGTDATLVEGNYIGTDALDRDLGNLFAGVRVNNEVEVVIGADAGTSDAQLPALANVIAYNGGSGVDVIGADSIVAARGNSIYSNTGLGIDLVGAVGVDANDAGDGDTGPNGLQNHPEFDPGQTVYDAQSDLFSTRVRVDSIPGNNSQYPLVLDFYVSDAIGEGRDWLGSAVYDAVDAQQFVDIAFTPQATVTTSDRVVATATDATGIGATSEFSGRIEVPEPGSRLSLLTGAAALLALSCRRSA